MAEFSITALRREVQRDPLGRGYAAMSNAQVAASLNTANRQMNAASLSGDEVFQATDLTEWAGLSDVRRLEWLTFCGRSSIDPFGAVNVSFVQTMFGGAGSATIANLAAKRRSIVSRGVELGAVGDFTAADVARIRSV